MHKAIILILSILASSTVLLFLSPTATAQNRLCGRLTDTGNHTPLPYATVRLMQRDSALVAGTKSDTLGCYSIDNVADGDYILMMSMVGYKDVTVMTNVEGDTRLPDIAMETDNTMLGEVIVEGRQSTRMDEKIIIIPNKKQIKHATTGYDLLNNLMIAGLTVDRRNQTVNSVLGDVALYIDGREADQTEVRNLRPRDIVKVEYIDVPHGKYAMNAVSINYITRKYKNGGYVAVDGTQGIGYLDGNYNATVKIEHGNTGFALFGGHLMRRYHGNGMENEIMRFSPNEITRTVTTDDAMYGQRQQYAQLNIQNSNDKRTLMIKAAFVNDNPPELYTRNSLTYTGIDGHDATSVEETGQKGMKPSIRLYGNFNINERNSLEASVDADYTKNDYRRRYEESGNSILTYNKENTYSVNADIDYRLRLRNKDYLTFHFQHLQKMSEIDYSSATETQRLTSGETTLTAEYRHRFNDNWMIYLQPGISSINYRVNKEQSRHVLSLRMNAHVFYTFRKNNSLLFEIFSPSSEHPQINYLNDVEQQIDLFKIQRGNPDLSTPKYFHTAIGYTGQFEKVNILLAGIFDPQKDINVSHYYLDGDKIVQSYTSECRMNRYAVILSLAWKPNDDLQINTDITYLNEKAKGLREAEASRINGSLRIAYFWKDFSINAFVKSPDSYLSYDVAKINIPTRYGLSVAWHYDGWSAEAGVENLFIKNNRMKKEITSDIYDHYTKTYDETDQQFGYVKVAYTFDFGRKISHEKNDVNRDINSAMMKAD